MLVAHPIGDRYGSDRVALSTVGALVGSGYSVTVALGQGGPLIDDLRAAGAEVIVAPTPIVRRTALRPVGLLQLVADTVRGMLTGVRILRRTRPDIVYVSTITVPLWLLLGRLTGRLTVCHVHEAEEDLGTWARRALFAPLCLAHLVIANSRFTAEVTSEGAPSIRHRTEVVANPVPGPSDVRAPRPEITDALRVVFIGRLSPRKGPHIAIRALGLLRDRGQPAQLELVGSAFPGYEWYVEELHALIRAEGLEQHVTMTGYRDDIWARYAHADVAVVPSTRPESFGNVVVQAVLARRPVVVTSSGGLPEAAEGLGSAIVVPPDDAASLAEALQTMVEEWPRRRQAAQADAETCAARHDPATYAATIIAAIEGMGEHGG